MNVEVEVAPSQEQAERAEKLEIALVKHPQALTGFVRFGSPRSLMRSTL